MAKQAQYINISKLDAAKRQLEFSIRLFLLEGDTVIIHALASASHEILWQLSKKRGIKSFLKNHLMERVKPEKKKEVEDMLKKPQNFFKHSGTDANEQLQFFFNTTQYTIWDACMMYKEITGENNPLVMTFVIWFYMNHTEVITDEKIKSFLENSGKVIVPTNRAVFLNELLPLAEKNLIPH